MVFNETCKDKNESSTVSREVVRFGRKAVEEQKEVKQSAMEDESVL